MPRARRIARWATRVAAALVWSLAVVAPAAAAALADTVEALKPSIVAVGTMQYSRRPAGECRGTGFAVADGRHVVTSAHVVPERVDATNGEFLAVFVGSGARVEARRARVVSTDRSHDLALIRFDGAALPPLKLAAEGRVREGELYAFTGFPLGALLGIYPVTHTGVVSSITPVLVGAGDGEPLDLASLRRSRSELAVYQIDATAYPGNSGSPLYQPETGRVIGIINKVYVRDGSGASPLEAPSGLTYAVPVRHLEELLAALGQ
jgi:S1-C subfamily serine protease